VRNALLVLLLLGAGAGCASGPPPIATGTPCAHCGMAVAQLRFACERKGDAGWRTYDAIECLLADDGADAPAWLTDYDSGALHPADSTWVVRGSFPSPMGGGYAAFVERSAADEIAARTKGTVARLAQFQARRGGGS